MNEEIKYDLTDEVYGVPAHTLPPVIENKTLSELVINTKLTIGFGYPMPNRWYRFWYKVLLGWDWRKV
jgi:hypothetical protein